MSKRPGDSGYAAGWCIHYRGITGPHGEIVTSCEKGVQYDSFRTADFKKYELMNSTNRYKFGQRKDRQAMLKRHAARKGAGT